MTSLSNLSLSRTPTLRRVIVLAALTLVVALALVVPTPSSIALPPGESANLIRLANNPGLSPDGKLLTFDWNGDVWIVPSTGGEARPLTTHPARDRDPKFSPDGKTIAFVSDRETGNQVFTIPVQGGTPKQLTYHTSGYNLQGWHPDGRRLITNAVRDHYWSGRGASRFILIDSQQRRAEQTIFDDYGNDGSLSPDGKKLLFTREGHQWWRKGYHGTQASQIWMYDLESKQFQPVIVGSWDARWPIWKADGSGFYYVGVPDDEAGKNAAPNLWEVAGDGKKVQLTRFDSESVVYPCMSKDGSTIVFRHLFDFYRYEPGKDKTPQKLVITYGNDRPLEKLQHRSLTTATSVAYSHDGLEIAFIAGGDLWVMDTELREPVQITKTPEEEREAVFSLDNDRILFVSDQGGQCDIWQVERADKSRYWFQNTSFKTTRLTNDADNEAGLKVSPNGKKLAFVKGRGELLVTDSDCKNPRSILKTHSPAQFNWSPDSKWLVYSAEDNDFNNDVFIVPIDGSRPPYNVSRHPFEDRNPTWSPDGKTLAFTSRRTIDETDVYYVPLTKDQEETTPRDRTLEKALEKLNRARTRATAPPVQTGVAGPGKGEPAKDPTKSDPPKQDDDQDQPPRRRGGGAPGAGVPSTGGESQSAPQVDETAPVRSPRVTNVEIDFDGLHERLHRISIPNSTESNLFWSPDGKRLAFNATVEGKSGVYAVEFPDKVTTPTQLSSQTITQPRWIRSNQILGSASGVPTSFALAGTTSFPTSYRFTALQIVDAPAKNAAAFDLAWRTMRDHFYDSKLGNRDWNAVREKYRAIAGEVVDNDSLGTIVQMMLGELNGSHLGFTVGRTTRPVPGAPSPTEPSEAASGTWREQTVHLGIRFDPAYQGPGLKIRDVLPKGPAELKKSRLQPGEIVTHINGVAVDPSFDLTKVLNLPPNHDVELKVKNEKGESRDVRLRPITYAAARGLLYEKWLHDNRAMVEKLSNDRLGYLHISGMSMPTFWKFQEELFSAGSGKDGLIIDVRENGGGSTADHLLTALTQPVHAVTIPRGGGPGYPSDRKIFATWNKPIVVMCNQNSFSNAEIFAHAIKTLKRGPVVGVTTAGGVISTGGTAIMDVGFLRLPFRGWYLVNDGQDMELNGCQPDHELWPMPGEMPVGKDRQLEKATEVLKQEVSSWQQKARPKLTKASERK